LTRFWFAFFAIFLLLEIAFGVCLPSSEGAMNLSALPSPLQKRDILYGVKKTSPEELRRLAASLAVEGWLSDAVDFLAQAKHQAGLNELRTRASAEGDSFLFLKISRLMGEADAPIDLLRQCGENAEAAGKNRYALKAYEKIGFEVGIERIRALIANDGDIKAEAESTVFIPASEDDLEEDED
jgi:hypothetical protein